MSNEISVCPYPEGTKNYRIWLEAFRAGEASGFEHGYFAAAVDAAVVSKRKGEDTDSAVEAIEREFPEEGKPN